MFSGHVREGKEQESEELERQIQMDAIFDLWENISALYLPAKNQITTEQTPSTQITSPSNPNLARAPNKRKSERHTDTQKEKEREQEGQERMMEGNGEEV